MMNTCISMYRKFIWRLLSLDSHVSGWVHLWFPSFAMLSWWLNFTSSGVHCAMPFGAFWRPSVNVYECKKKYTKRLFELVLYTFELVVKDYRVCLQGAQGPFMSVPQQTVELFTYSPIHLDVLGPDPPDEEALETNGQVFFMPNRRFN